MANNANVNKVVYGNDTLIDLTGDTVAAGDVLSGKTFHKADGTAGTGSMTNNGASNINITKANTRILISEGYYNGNGSAGISTTEAAKIKASNIKSGVTILGVEGSVSPAKNEQAKTVTATTTQQVVTPDVAPSPGNTLSSVTVNPQVHSDTYTPTGYSNAKDMGAQHNYRYVDTSGYEPTSITPSSTPTSVSSGDIVKFDGNGSVVDRLESLIPSNSMPNSIHVGEFYQALAPGIAIETYTELDQTSTPIALYSDSFYKPKYGGTFVTNIVNKTPSNSSPPSVSANGNYHINTNNGYLYQTIQKPQNVACILGSGVGSTSYTHANINPVGSYTQFVETDYFDFDNGSGNLTVTKAFSGYLYLYVSSGRNSSGTTIYCYCDVRINGTSNTTLNTNSSNNTRATSKQISLAVGDVISVYSKVNTGSASAYTKWMLTLKTTIQPSSGTA